MGILNFIGSIFGYLLWGLYLIFKNYGVAIIMFTVLLKVIMFPLTLKQQKSMAAQARLTEKQKALQKACGNDKQRYNEEHGITPQTIKKAVRDLISISKKVAAEELRMEKDPESMSKTELEKLIKDVSKQMRKAAAELNFEAAAGLRDKMIELKKRLLDMEE